MASELDKKLTQTLEITLSVSENCAKGIIKKAHTDLEKVRIDAVIRFLSYSQRVKEDSFLFRLLGSLFVLESLCSAKENNKTRKVQGLLRENIEFEDKISLLGGFMFSRKYEFRRESIHPLRHIMFGDFDKDERYKKENYITEVKYCNAPPSSMCHCVNWIRKNPSCTDRCLDTLISYLYEMRHAVVHEAFPVFGLPDYSEKNTGGFDSASLLDTYPVSKDKKYFRGYESYIDPDIFFTIIKNCVRNYLLK
ncbi:MAG: hypothetical protein ABIH22_00460 [Candidatus Margulisiibacteriota bacterium]